MRSGMIPAGSQSNTLDSSASSNDCSADPQSVRSSTRPPTRPVLPCHNMQTSPQQSAKLLPPFPLAVPFPEHLFLACTLFKLFSMRSTPSPLSIQPELGCFLRLEVISADAHLPTLPRRRTSSARTTSRIFNRILRRFSSTSSTLSDLTIQQQDTTLDEAERAVANYCAAYRAARETRILAKSAPSRVFRYVM